MRPEIWVPSYSAPNAGNGCVTDVNVHPKRISSICCLTSTPRDILVKFEEDTMVLRLGMDAEFRNR